jgi:hypothetical protein
MDMTSIIKQNPQVAQLFNDFYPDLNIENLDDELIKDIIGSVIGNTFNDFSMQPIDHNAEFKKRIIEENYDLADANIPEMLIPTDLIYLNAKINNIPVKILFDTGASSNCIFKSKIIEAGLDDIVDKNYKIKIQGINSGKDTYGHIWYTELEFGLNLNSNEQQSTMVGVNFMVIDDEGGDKNLNKFDIILGLTFMKSYRTNIDFLTKTITLNNKIKIKFD